MLWVAEVGSAHKGNLSLAHEYIRAYSQAGASVIKFQYGWTRKAQRAMGLKYNPVRYIDDWAMQLNEWCFQYGVYIMASIWSEEGLEAAEQSNLDFYKIGYQMWKRNPDFARKVERLHNVIISGRDTYVVSEYPTYPGRLHMPERFDKVMGYSDHSHGIGACLLAVARGATYIEKHVALDKTDLVTKDTPFSATPDEFAEMVRVGTEMRRWL